MHLCPEVMMQLIRRFFHKVGLVVRGGSGNILVTTVWCTIRLVLGEEHERVLMELYDLS